MRSACLHCYKFRMSDVEMERFCSRFDLLKSGNLVEALSLVIGSSSASKKSGKDLMGSDTEESDIQQTETKSFKKKLRESDGVVTSQMMETMITTVRDFFKGQPSGKCQNCGAHSPTLKREGHTKLFLMPLSAKKRQVNEAQGTSIVDLLSDMNPRNHPQTAVLQMVDSPPIPEEEDVKDTKFKMETSMDESPTKETMLADKREKEAGTPGVDMPKYLTPTEAKEIMRRVWRENIDILKYIYPTDITRREIRKGSESNRISAGDPLSLDGYKEFFIQTIPVAPNRFRPVNHVGDMVYEHPQNTILVKIINANLDLIGLSKEQEDTEMSNKTSRLTQTLRLWLNLQNSLNALIDSSTADDTYGVNGIRQQLEKKEGLFRKNMMGKRVNFAARSVISPDVFLNGGEIGVPPYFASRLSFPERVTPWNLERLREAVIAGPGKIPGALAVEDERGRVVMLRKDKKSRESIAKTLSASSHGGAGPVSNPAAAQYGGGKVVYRTMTDGDFMLTNRQPTLHKPGMMGHRARIMRAERTIRFHYANCSTFNADFDGDEINLHLPQDHLGRAEGLDIVHADQQFFVPTDGKPLRGLIQDHIVAGTLMTMKDRFLTQAESCQLIYEAIAQDCNGGWDIWMDKPSIVKPKKLWTGKQVFTAVLMHYTRDQLPLNMAAKCKTPNDAWGKHSGEEKMHIWRNHLLTGIVDKSMFGKNGLMHVFHVRLFDHMLHRDFACLTLVCLLLMQELYGSDRTSILTAALSRLFTGFLQKHGFTCGIADVLLVEKAEQARSALLDSADSRALAAAADFVNVEESSDDIFNKAKKVEYELEKRFLSNSVDVGAALDMKMSGAMHPLSSEVVKACLPEGQAKSFRHNMMALMTMTGAKGSVVNFSQISCLLGQQELEGRRVPRMASGKTLPCFAAYDSGARSGGFVADRFLTGLKPQEYYFHCMAGREGLVDTTVKTSRSGYLQRCLVKNLEPLRVGYDGTVRDDCDGSIVQFLYGEDGQNPISIGCLRSLPLLYFNMPQFSVQLEAHTAKEKGLFDLDEQSNIYKAIRKRSSCVLKGKEYKELPLNGLYSQNIAGVTSESFQDALTNALFGGYLLPRDPDSVKTTFKEIEKMKKSNSSEYRPMDVAAFHELMQIKYYCSRAEPGEAVGVVAAQSIGEPSTQMTLNTFHMAGRGEANVTLGIPRLREILMTAAETIKTPVMTLPLLPDAGAKGAAMSIRMKQILFGEALKGIQVIENIVTASKTGDLCRSYLVRIQFHPLKDYPQELNITFEELSRCFSDEFSPKIKQAVKAEMKKLASARGINLDEKFVDSAPRVPKAVKQPGRKDDDDENKEVDEDNEEGKLRFAGGRGEIATYGEGDDEDMQIEKNAREAAAELAGDTNLDDTNDDENLQVEDIMEDLGDDGAPDEIINKSALTCELSLTVPVDAPKIMMRELVEKIACSTVMRGIPGITKCYVLDAASRGEHVLQTDGINIEGVWSHADLIDVSRISTNSPAAMLKSLGVEAARATIMAEVSSVFGAYGIAVDPRHLTLIADYMTHTGGYRACNRLGIESSTSPFLKMSFETAANFLISATLHRETDPLTSASSRIVVGRPISAGTGSLDILQET